MNKKIIGILLISIFLFSNISSVFASDDKSYNIDFADIILDIEENGILHVRESYLYSFKGEYNGVYRDISIKNGESVENINITTEGAFSDYEISEENGYYKLKIYLYADEAKTQKISNTDVKVNIEYDYKNSIKIYNDVGELHYKLWGEEWDVAANEINAQINFKSVNGIKYWINPYYNLANSHFKNNSLIIHDTYTSSGDYLEIRAIIPLSQFNDPIYANKINGDGLAEIEKIQEDYKNQMDFEDKFYSIISIILLLSFLVPIGIYLKYGREPKIQYNALYERDPPTKDPPIFVNAMFDGKIGSLNDRAFQASVMDLINRKYINLCPNSTDDNIILKLNYEQDFSKLKDYEIDLVNILKFIGVNGIIDFKKIRNILSSQAAARKFSEKYQLWKSDYEKINVDSVIDKYFINDGNTYFKIYGFILLIISIVIFLLSFNSIVPSASDATFISVISFLIGIICLQLPSSIAGRWTEFGMDQNKRWKNFKKFLNDFSLIKEHPPSSIAIWNQYLVYGTALGVAKNVKKAMDINLPTDSLANNDLYYYNSYGGSFMLYSAMNSGMSSANAGSHSSGGFGGAGGPGGGSGGGGGGAF